MEQSKLAPPTVLIGPVCVVCWRQGGVSQMRRVRIAVCRCDLSERTCTSDLPDYSRPLSYLSYREYVSDPSA